MNASRLHLMPACLFCLLLCTPTLFAQTASIEGVVLRGTNDPLPKTRVELRRDTAEAGVLDTMVTEEDGRFSFANVRPGRYRIAVTRQGYLGSPMTLDVIAGQPVAPLQLLMKATGAIYGRVLDSQGNGMGNINVQALKSSYATGR